MDDLERDLTISLRERSDTVEVPHLALGAVIALGHREASAARRRNTMIALIAVAAAVVAIAIPVGIESLHGSSPGPSTHPTLPPSSQYQVLSFIDSIQAPSDVALAADGAIATLWSRCGIQNSSQPCQVAWMLQRGTGPGPQLLSSAATYVGWAPSDAHLSVSGVNLVATSYASDQAFVINNDGSTTPLRLLKAATPIPSQITGASAVEHNGGIRLVNAGDGTWMPALDDEGNTLGTAVVDGSTLWGERDAGDRIVVERSSDGGAWASHPLLGSAQSLVGPIAASHGHAVAAASLPNTELAGISVTDDNAGTWTDVEAAALPFDDISGVATTSNGSMFLSSAAGTLFEATDLSWTTFAAVTSAPRVRVLQADYDKALVLEVSGGLPVRLGTVSADGTIANYGPSFADLVPPLASESPSANVGPGSLEDLAMGALPKVPYLRDGLVVMNGIPTKAPPATNLIAAAGIVVLEGKHQQNGTVPYYVFRGYGWQRATWLGSYGEPVLSADAQYAGVLTYPDDIHTRINLVDPLTGHSYGSIDQPGAYSDVLAGSIGIRLLGVDLDGNLYWTDGPALMRWTSWQSVPTRIGNANQAVAVNALGIVMTHPNEPGVLYLVRADTSGNELPAASADGVWSNDGHRVLVGATVIDVETGAEYAMALPPQMAVTPLGFEDDDTVELLVHNSGAVYPADHPASILRCRVATQTCERADNLADLQNTQFPSRF